MSSGFPLFINSKPVSIAVFLYTAAGLAIYKPKLKWLFNYTVVFSLLMFIQTCYFGMFYVTTALNQVMLFLTAAMSIALLGTTFIFLYIRIMVVIAAIATLLFIPILINNSFAEILIAHSPLHFTTVLEVYGYESISHNLFFINFPPDFMAGLIRNSGPFWEPGAFGGYLIIAYVFNTLVHNTLLRKSNIILVIAIITTFSTTAYIGLSIFTVGFLFLKIKDQVVKWSVLAVMLIVVVFSFRNVDFLGNKIKSEISETKYNAFIKGGDTRTASAYLDLKELTENSLYLFFGRGSHPHTRVAGVDKEVLRTNGVTDLLSRFGLLFFVVSLYFIWDSFRLVSKLGDGEDKMAYLGLVTVLLISFSEVYFIYVLFKALILLRMAEVEEDVEEDMPVRERRRNLSTS
jgi:hypothetical protein